MHDMMGFGQAWTFVKVFGDARAVMDRAVRDYIREVKDGTFPSKEHEHS
jgi:ketopantoate hydroxymethyltransferase